MNLKITKIFFEALERMAAAGKMELAKQGHRASGKLVDSIEAQLKGKSLDGLVGLILAEDYGLYVDSGVSSSNIPFSGSGGGGTSKYIQALMDWAAIVKPGLSARERKSFVFAVANVHKKEGMPTRGSYAFSSNGRRTGWIEHGLEKHEPRLDEDIENMMVLLIDAFDRSVLAAAA